MNYVIRWQRFEGLIVFVAAVLIYVNLPTALPWWLAILVFFAPDLSFFAYLFGTKVGAFAYNLVHVYAFGVVFLALGNLLQLELMFALGVLWLAHSGFDRMLGYGLKLPEGFNKTHLGSVGVSKS